MMTVNIKVGDRYQLRGSESQVEVTRHLFGSSVHFKVVTPEAAASDAEHNMTEDEFQNYAFVPGQEAEAFPARMADIRRGVASGGEPPPASQEQIRRGLAGGPGAENGAPGGEPNLPAHRVVTQGQTMNLEDNPEEDLGGRPPGVSDTGSQKTQADAAQDEPQAADEGDEPKGHSKAKSSHR